MSKTQPSAVLIAKVLVVVILAVSPRALLTPVARFDRAMESKRPKCPKNVVRADAFRIDASEKQGHSPPLPRAELLAQDLVARLSWTLQSDAVPASACPQLTKPDYLKFFGPSALQSHLDPPA